MPFDTLRDFPALTLIRFFDNHGMLGISTHPQWKALSGGSNTYMAPLTAPYRKRVLTGALLKSVARTDSAVELRFVDRPAMSFDHVVFACHGDQVLPLLEAPTEAERDVLSGFTTSRNEVCLHSDSRLLPRRRAARASWNYNLRLSSGHTGGATVTYHMNRLQSLRAQEDYCVTLNGNDEIDSSKVLRRLVYRHPVYNRRAIAAQSRWREISGARRTHFCGAYWFYGFHEDGLNSAMRVARSLGVEC